MAMGAKCSKAGMGKLEERKGLIIFFLANLVYTARKRKVLLDIIPYFLALEVRLYACSMLCSSNKQKVPKQHSEPI